MTDLSADQLQAAIVSPRYAALTQLGKAVGDLHRWDFALLREPRLLVPVDVCALVVHDGDEAMVRLPFRSDGETAPDPADAGTPRPVGVHLLWSVPATFGRGTIVADPTAPDDVTRRLLELRPLPDRWVVLRLLVPVGAVDPLVRGWVIEADEATVTPLEDWPDVRTRTETPGTPVPAEQLTVHVGGPNWTSSYDAALGHLALHDPLDDLDALAPDGVVGDALTYVVGGWWSDAQHDPLDGVGSIVGYQERLRVLGWVDPDHPAPEYQAVAAAESSNTVAKVFDLPVASRYAQASPGAQAYRAASSSFVSAAAKVATIPSAPTRTTLLTGRIHGVPWKSAGRPDDRPDTTDVRVALGPTSPSVGAVLASGAISTPTTADEQGNAERLLAAFTSGLLARVEQPDVWPDIDQYEHAQGFSSTVGGIEAVDRFVDKQGGGNDPGSGARPGRRGALQYEELTLVENVLWSSVKYPVVLAATKQVRAAGGVKAAIAMSGPGAAAAAASARSTMQTRTVERPAPPFQTPVSPVLAVVGAGRRILAAERDEADGTLRVRTSDQPDRGLDGILAADELLRTIGSGAVPDEMLPLAREALAADPHLAAWRQSRVQGANDFREAAGVRMRAEASLNYAYYAGDHALLGTITGAVVDSAATRQVAVEGLAKHSLSTGVWAHPEGVTMWGQPWRPIFCEWTAQIDLAGLAELIASEPAGWSLGEIDLERIAAFTGGETITLSGRSPLVAGVAQSLAAAVDRWITDERTRDAAGHGLASAAVEQAMVGLRTHLRQLDVLSVTLDGIREQLLGWHYDRGVLRKRADAGPDGAVRPLALALPRLVLAGRVRVTSARLVDSFGRLLPLPLDTAVVVARATETVPGIDGAPDLTTPGATMQLRPRITAPARLHLRLVDQTAFTGDAATALVDQAEPTAQVNPVAGFLLPDHIDEALEMFSTDGTPLGQVSHDPFSDAVYWEGAPGRVDIGPAAGPLDDPRPERRRLGWLAAGLVTVDATDRQASPVRLESESPLSALLRAIDTTLWSVDPFGALGREHIVGLVGRPIAVVTAQLTLEVQDDLDELVYGDATSREARAAAFAELAAVPFAVRLGSVTRSDDGLLGYFVDDDYTRLHVIDREIAEQARNTGRARGDLGVEGDPTTMPITHRYVVPDGTVTIRRGQTLRLTLLMHPAGKVHVSSGIVPRMSVALARDWVQPGLSVMAPSVRVGPLLIDADKVRLPKVSAFPADQLFTRRDTPGSWKDDAILAATQTAYLPDQASTVQEGWVRITPTPPPPTATTGGASSPTGTG